MKLICPVTYMGKKYVEAEITDPSGGVIADTNKIIENNGNVFLALLTFVKGNITELKTEDGEVVNNLNTISSIVRSMTYKTIENFAIQQLLLYNDDDRVEGIYSCPLCKNQIKCEKTDEDDNTDRINDLEIIYQDDNVEFLVEFENEFIIKDKKGNELEKIKNMSFVHPTIQTMIDSYTQYIGDEVRMHYKAYEKSIVKVNGIDVTKDWKTKYAKVFFEGQKNKEINKITRVINSVGIQSTIEKICNKCGRVFKVNLNTANFFVSSLQFREE